MLFDLNNPVIVIFIVLLILVSDIDESNKKEEHSKFLIKTTHKQTQDN